jgi:hypothetical protein
MIDLHVHVVGTGAGGTGCWLNAAGWRYPLVRLMLAQAGLSPHALQGDFDRLYVERLRTQLHGSSLTSAVLLAHDNVYDERGSLREGIGSFYVPNDYVLALAQKFPEFRAGVSIHPGRKDALAELEACLQRGAALLKLLPNCHNVNCNDRRYQKFWETMAAAGLPLLAHTGGEHTVPVVQSSYANPRVLELPLQCGVTVIAAHCGTKSGLVDPDYFPTFVAMTRQYERLYGDNSAFNVPIRGRHIRECLVPPVADRIVHGSDYPVPIIGYWNCLRGLLDWQTCRRLQQLDSALERDYQLKKAVGFSAATFTRAESLLRPRPGSGSARAHS